MDERLLSLIISKMFFIKYAVLSLIITSYGINTFHKRTT